VRLLSSAAVPSVRELRRQVDGWVGVGLPEASGCPEDELRALAAELEPRLPDGPFVLVPSRELLAPERAIAMAVWKGRRGFTTMDADDVARFRPTDDVDVPDAPLYLVTDVDTGRDTLGVRPDDALPGILAAGRTPLTLEEGLAVAVQHPGWLRERNCFEMLGSRAGDRRVTGVWVSKGAPRLGWCWGGNPHTWLGMASASGRIG
jgi:hypothetical protein